MKIKANWSGIVSIDIEIEADNDKVNDTSMGEATHLLEDELTTEIKEAIGYVCDFFPDGGEVQISDVCIEPFQVVEGE